MRDSLKQVFRFASVLFAVACLIGCGGGGESESVVSPASGIVMSWTPPDRYSDQTPLNPETDLYEYEIYLNQTGSFDSDDTPVAYVATVNHVTVNATSSFDLGNLGASISAGKTYYICMRSVTTSGARSGFSPVLSFTI